MLLQRRRHRVFDGIWDLTAATHLLHGQQGDETLDDAAARCLESEYGLHGVATRPVGAFTYFARDGLLCENEHCSRPVGQYDGAVTLNRAVGYGYAWLDREVLRRNA